MATDDFLGQAQGATHLAHLVFKQAPQWFHQLELEILGQAADVVVALDLDGNPLAGFGIDVGARRLDHIGIEGALGQEIKGTEALTFFLKYPNKFGADNLTFLLGIRNSSQLADEAITGIDVFDIDMETLVKKLDQKFWLPLAHEALIDEHAGELVADRLVQ